MALRKKASFYAAAHRPREGSGREGHLSEVHGTLALVAHFFHVDRNSALSAGQTLTLTRVQDLPADRKIADAALQAHVEALFPGGLSIHGMGYLFAPTNGILAAHQAGFYDAKALGLMRSHAIDALYEYVRRASFDDRPSRYQSLFCWESREDAARFIDATSSTGVPVWEVDGESLFRADMNLLSVGTALSTSLAAHRYWRGEAALGLAPRWEHFVAPGARILGRVA